MMYVVGALAGSVIALLLAASANLLWQEYRKRRPAPIAELESMVSYTGVGYIPQRVREDIELALPCPEAPDHLWVPEYVLIPGRPVVGWSECHYCHRPRRRYDYRTKQSVLA